MGGLADKNVTREPKARNKGNAPGTGPMGNLGPPDDIGTEVLRERLKDTWDDEFLFGGFREEYYVLEQLLDQKGDWGLFDKNLL